MQMDCYLRLLDPKGVMLEEDGSGDLSARIVFKCPEDGDFKVVATSLGGGTGNYNLLIKLAGGAQPPSAAHLKMIGKDAPDFSGDFAVNGKPVSLSDLEGKIVLLHFWEARSSASAAMMPRLNDLHRSYEGKGLVILGLTFYTSDIGQHLKFDKESGAVQTAPAADRQSDQKLLAEYAAHHKVKHRLLAMPKQDALDAFESYFVNGLPQVVLIDRKGQVRMIDINGEKGIGQVELELKKLLAEK
jgi:peroxiredoxin